MVARPFWPPYDTVTMAAGTVAVSAMVTAYRRPEQTIETLHRINGCAPSPQELLVHVDGGERGLADAVQRACPRARVMVSDANVGPGGGRNAMIALARHDIVASFDDDSYPIDADYFARVQQLFASHPAAWVLSAAVFHRQDATAAASPTAEWVADFVGCGCAYRRLCYTATGGYVPMPTAYGMEEADFSLRLHALGGRVLRSGLLRVFHDTDLAHHDDPRITSASIVNVALLAYLRYPPSMWLFGAAQCANRIQWLIRHGRHRGVLAGIGAIPSTLASYRSQRRPLSPGAVRSFMALRRRAQPA